MASSAKSKKSTHTKAANVKTASPKTAKPTNRAQKKSLASI